MNPVLKRTAVMFERAGKEKGAAIWLKASDMLTRPATTRVEINVSRISRISSDGAKVFVPGKVLGAGVIDKKVTVGAFSYSSAAKAKIEAKGGTLLSAEQFLSKYPDGSGVKIVE
jgi:large subunit ribosomal protein L18e